MDVSSVSSALPTKVRFTLVPLDGGFPIEIVKDITVIGRKKNCDVQIDDPSVSKVHLLLVMLNGVLVFRDMASTNGTKINGQRVVRGELLLNDKIDIAGAKYRLLVESGEQPVKSVPMADNVDLPVDQPADDNPVVRVDKAPPE